MTPLVYVLEEQVRDLLAQTTATHLLDGVAYGFDDWTVFHAYTEKPPSTPAGFTCPCVATRSDAAGLVDEQKLMEQVRGRIGLDGRPIVVLVAGTDAKGSPSCRALIVTGNGAAGADTRFVPRRSELFARNTGLLEVSALAEKKVVIVGLGSGGSPIALELARAGIGHFTLIDFDRLELGNISRHVCGVNDLGRYKTLAVRDQMLQKNPYADVSTLEINVNQALSQVEGAVAACDLLIVASDNDQSRFNLNQMSLNNNKVALYGRAITRAAGGDVLRVRPWKGPCYNCVFSSGLIDGREEEMSQKRQALAVLPAYVEEDKINTMIQVGLSSDIAPIANMMVKMALVELSRGIETGMSTVEEDLASDFYVWANRREEAYANWPRMGFKWTHPSILRWYGARIDRDPDCLVCGGHLEEGPAA
ncbi:MAG: HesA/MoeB/ThiF family protein [Candidatus Cryosericum sp.]